MRDVIGTVVHVELGRHWTGGARQVLLLARGLQRCGVSTQLICPKGAKLAERARQASLPVCPVPAASETDLRLWVRLAQWLRRLDTPLLHLHSRRGLLGVCLLARWMKVPLVIHWRTAAFMPPFALQGADAVIAVSKAAARAIGAQNGARWKVVVIPDAVDADAWQPPPNAKAHTKTRWGLDSDAFVVAGVGRLIPDKGYGCVVEALALLTPSERPIVLLAGEGHDAARLQRLAKQLGVADSVRWLGFQDDVRPVLWAADVFVHPSRREGLSCAILEAMAAGLPVIATSVGGIPELVRHGETGLLVPPDAPTHLADALRRLRAEKALRQRLGTNAQRFVREHHTPEGMVAATLAVYRRLRCL